MRWPLAADVAAVASSQPHSFGKLRFTLFVSGIWLWKFKSNRWIGTDIDGSIHEFPAAHFECFSDAIVGGTVNAEHDPGKDRELRSEGFAGQFEHPTGEPSHRGVFGCCLCLVLGGHREVALSVFNDVLSFIDKRVIRSRASR